LKDFWIKVDKTLRYHGQQALRGLRGVWWDVARTPGAQAVIIVGCSRAGTTVVYKTFSASDAIGSLNREPTTFWVDLHPLSNKHWDTHGLAADDASAADRDYVSRYFYTWTGQSASSTKTIRMACACPTCIPCSRMLTSFRQAQPRR